MSPGPDVPRSTLEDEVRAMADWAAAKGLGPAPAIAQELAPIESPSTPMPGAPDADPGEARQEADSLAAVRLARRDEVIRAHAALTKKVAPALPGTILRLAQENAHRDLGGTARFTRALGPLPIVRRVVAATIFFLVLFVLLASSQDVRTTATTLTDSKTETETETDK